MNLAPGETGRKVRDLSCNQIWIEGEKYVFVS